MFSSSKCMWLASSFHNLTIIPLFLGYIKWLGLIFRQWIHYEIFFFSTNFKYKNSISGTKKNLADNAVICPDDINKILSIYQMKCCTCESLSFQWIRFYIIKQLSDTKFVSLSYRINYSTALNWITNISQIKHFHISMEKKHLEND